MLENGPIPLTSSSPPDTRWELVMRVADSVYFRKGPKLRAFLLYVCENTLLGRRDNVREQLIGSKVFGRPADYNLTEDNIVRVEARQLRQRLDAYFAAEGQNEPVLIEIPKGSYVPVFKPREEAASNDVVESVEGNHTALVPATSRPNRWLVLGLAAGLLVSLAATTWLGVERWRLRANPGADVMDTNSEYHIYSELLGSLGQMPNRQAQLVLANPKVILLFGSTKPNPHVEASDELITAPKDMERLFHSALNGKDAEMTYHYFRITREDYTGTGDAMAAAGLMRLMDLLHRRVHLTQARFMNWDSAPQEDLILLAGPSANTWTYQTDTSTDFVFSGRSIRNLHPLPGEQKEYRADEVPDSKGAMTEYGFLKMHATPEGFRTLLLAGLGGAGTAGVAAFFASPAKMSRVADQLASASPNKHFPSDWEVLMRITVQDGLPVATSAVTIHTIPH